MRYVLYGGNWGDCGVNRGVMGLYMYYIYCVMQRGYELRECYLGVRDVDVIV